MEGGDTVIDINRVSAAQHGNQAAFLGLIEPLARLYQTALGIVGNECPGCLAEHSLSGLAQATCAARSAFFQTWLTRILLNQAKAVLRNRRRPRPGTVLPEPAVVTLPSDQQLEVRACLMQLSQEQRTAVLLRFWLDLPLSEIARAQGVPLSTAKTRLYEGIRRLRTLMKEAEEHDRTATAG
ncbi:MAG: RNA polymerase sigma factor [Bacillota bacterium]